MYMEKKAESACKNMNMFADKLPRNHFCQLIITFMNSRLSLDKLSKAYYISREMSRRHQKRLSA